MRKTTWLVTLGVALTTALHARQDVTNERRAAPESAVGSAGATRVADAVPAAFGATLAHLTEEAEPGPGGSLVIANLAYRAELSAGDGLVQTPRVNGRLEPRLAWRFTAHSLATDTTTRALSRVVPIVIATGAHVVDFVRDGLIERYEGERNGVEQIFVLERRPEGRGDVRVTGAVAFAGTVRRAGDGLLFEAGQGLPPFAYAAPVAFDAARRPVPVRVEAGAGTLSLVLDGAALDRAAWPVTDWDRNGYLDLAVFNEQSGGWNIQYGGQFHATVFGAPGDVPVAH